MKNDTKFGDELTCRFKIATTDFDPSTPKSQKFTV